MSRRTWVAVATALVASVAAIYFYVDNRRLSREATRLRAEAEAARVAAAPVDEWAAAMRDDDDDDVVGMPGMPRGLGGAIDSVGRPELPDTPKESRLARRLRQQQELAGRFGRLDGETEEEYRDRVMPLVGTMLARPRDNVATMRAEVEALAGVTEAQRQELDAAFEAVYDDLLSYTDAAIADGQLTPYERNVAGLLDYSGGLGSILTGAEGKIGQILSSSQTKAITDSGFEWAEYLGVSAPWERLTPPPPPPPGGS